MEQLIGAMQGGRDNHTLCSSPSRTWKLCSRTAYMIRPIPKEGSMTDGTTSTTKEHRERESIAGHMTVM